MDHIFTSRMRKKAFPRGAYSDQSLCNCVEFIATHSWAKSNERIRNVTILTGEDIV